MCARYRSADEKDLIVNYRAQLLPRPNALFYSKECYPSYQGLFLFNNNKAITYTAGFWSLQYRFKKTTEVSSKFATFNARVETIDEKPTYKHPWNDGFRCIIPVRYFIEWRGEKGSKEPLAIRPKNQELFQIAGLYEPDGFGGYSYTMLTCEPNEQMAKIHHRMPVILDDWQKWLDPNLPLNEAKSMCLPYGKELTAHTFPKNDLG